MEESGCKCIYATYTCVYILKVIKITYDLNHRMDRGVGFKTESQNGQSGGIQDRIHKCFKDHW